MVSDKGSAFVRVSFKLFHHGAWRCHQRRCMDMSYTLGALSQPSVGQGLWLLGKSLLFPSLSFLICQLPV